MLWKVFLAIASVVTSPFSVTVDPDKPHDIKQGWIDPDAPYHATPYGPQSWQEAERAAHALYGHGSDMILNEDDEPSYAAKKGDMYRWPNNTVYYDMSPEIANNKTMLNLVKDGMKHIESQTCIKFVQRTNQTQYVSITRDADKCYAEVGYLPGATVRLLSLGESCQYKGIVVHELMHSLGCYHEHQRTDRDNHIIIYTKNIIPKEMHNFNITEPKTEDKMNMPYDTESVMHYGSLAFSKNRHAGLLTMVTKSYQIILETFQKPGMTKNDVELVKKMYNC